MNLKEIIGKLELSVVSGEERLDAEVKGGYVSDLMSDVIAHTESGVLWITLQIHLNIVAVAVMKELCGIIIIGGRQPEAATLEKAKTENLPIMITPLSAYEIAGRLYQLGIPGTGDA